MKKSDYINKLHSQSLTDESAILADIKELIQTSKSEREDREVRRGIRKKKKQHEIVTTPLGVYDPSAPSEAELKFKKLMSQSMNKPGFDPTGNDKRDLSKPLLGHTIGNSEHSKKSTSTSRNSHNVSSVTDELLRKYANELRNAKPLPLTKDELRIKSSIMPYSGTTAKVDSYLVLDAEITSKNNKDMSSTMSPSLKVSKSESEKITSKTNIDKKSFANTDNKAISQQTTSNNPFPDLMNLDGGSNPNVNKRLKHVSAQRFCKKYPRYCSSIPAFSDEELRKIIPRSDWWVYKFLELCYDDALLAFNTPQSHGKQKIYYGLNVGCLDAFPLLVQRVVGRYYSVLDMRKTISLEILYSIELMIERSEFARFKDGFVPDKVKYDGGRCVLFSKFLSEEYDVDILALFLLGREIVQQVAGHRLKDMTPARIWVESEATDKKVLKAMLTQKVVKEIASPTTTTTKVKSDTNIFTTEIPNTPMNKTTNSTASLDSKSKTSEQASKGSYVDKMRQFQAKSEKVTPFILPSKWYFVDDASLPEAPLVAFDQSMLPYICSLVIPSAEIPDRQYFVDRVIDVSASDLLREGSKEEKRKYVSQIPVYSFLRSLCLEWKKLSAEEKTSLNDYSSQIYESLRSLNSIYDNNCEELKLADEKVSDAEAQMITMNAAVLQFEKELKRLEKKWNAQVATPAELARLGVVREELAKQKVQRLAAEQQLHEIEMSRKKMRHNVESLWDVAMEKVPAFTGKENGKLVNKVSKKQSNDAVWMLFSKHMFQKTVELNKKKFLELKESMAKSQRLAAEITKTLTIKAMPPEVMKLSLIETLARIVARNVINAGKRKAILRDHLNQQELSLLMKYNNKEYLRREQERLRKEREEHLQKLRLQLTTALAKTLTMITVQDAIEEGRKRAFLKLYDPWWMLDIAIPKLVPPVKQRRVEQMFAQAVDSTKKNHLSIAFREIRIFWSEKRITTRRELLQKKNCFNFLRSYKLMIDRTRSSVLSLQKVAKAFLWTRRCARHLKRSADSTKLAIIKDNRLRRTYRLKSYVRHWLKMSKLSLKYKKCCAALEERRFLLCFYTWLHEYKKICFRNLKYSQEQNQGAVKIQSVVRRFLATRRCRKLKAYATLSQLVLRFRANKTFNNMLAYRRRIECFGAEWIKANQNRNYQLAAWKLWFKVHKVLFGLNKLDHAYTHQRMRRRFTKWINFTIYRTRYLTKKVIKIQSAARMFAVHAQYFSFYRFRKQLIKLQSNWRRYKVRKAFIHTIYYYRHARSIQRVMRGWMVRKKLVNRRIEDIHYAAHANNYDRLKYYIDKFPHLVTQADGNGNTALHNAAYGAAKRTLKLLIKEKVFEDVNIMNVAGYSPLHLLITSSAVHRDELFGYMIERGFDEDLLTLTDEKTCLLLAVEYGRVGIMKRLLDDGHDTNIQDKNGLTCLQSACLQGDAVMVRALLDNEANAHLVGSNGAYPVHDSITGGNIDVLNMLLQYHIDINVLDESYHQTPLMWASQYGKAQFISQLIIYNADIYYADASGRNCTHYAAISNNVEVYQALRVADVDFDSTDNEGNTPLHLASYYGAEEFARNLLEGGCFPSFQNNQGDTPAHVAARYNQLELIKLICEFDTQIGKMNYAHQSPLGVAKFYQSFEVIMFLETHYRMVEIIDGRNEIGEIWWDKDIDMQIAEWEMHLEPDGGRYFVNKRTGIVSRTPPSLSLDEVQKMAKNAALPYRRNVIMVKEDSNTKNTLTKHQYYIDFYKQKEEIAVMSVDYDAATVINKYARRKLAIMALLRIKKERRHRIILTRFIKRHLPGFMLYRKYYKSHKARKIQSRWRGYIYRKKFYSVPDGEYFVLRHHLAHRRIRYQLWSIWTLYKRRQTFAKLVQIKNMPRTISDWAHAVEQARFPKRVVGVYEEYLFPNTNDIHFYRHNINGACTFMKPKKMIIHDEQEKLQADQIKKFGATIPQIELTIKLQALWRAYKIRNYYYFLEKAMEISQFAEKKYLEAPERDVNLYNYALHCFAIQQDIDRARHVFLESLRRMQWRGPDVAFVLYAYCIFGLVSGDEEYLDVLPLLHRAKKAEFARVMEMRKRLDREITEKANAISALAKSTAGPISSADLMSALSEDVTKVNDNKLVLPVEDQYSYGKVFDLANTGFFRFAANTINNGLAWCNYGVCRYVVYNDFPSSFDAFMLAFTQDPNNPKIKRNFDIMMTHFHGPDKDHQDKMVKERQRHHAQEDADLEEQRRILRDRARQRFFAARTIQLWYKNRKSFRIFSNFIDNVKRYIKKQVKLSSKAGSRVTTAHPNNKSPSRVPSARTSVATPKTVNGFKL